MKSQGILFSASIHDLSCVGYIYQQFLRQEDYDEIVQHAKDLSGLLWASDKRRILCVSSAAHDSIREYLKRKINKE
jgi:hypothetical protein